MIYLTYGVPTSDIICSNLSHLHLKLRPNCLLVQTLYCVGMCTCIGCVWLSPTQTCRYKSHVEGMCLKNARDLQDCVCRCRQSFRRRMKQFTVMPDYISFTCQGGLSLTANLSHSRAQLSRLWQDLMKRYIFFPWCVLQQCNLNGPINGRGWC